MHWFDRNSVDQMASFYLFHFTLLEFSKNREAYAHNSIWHNERRWRRQTHFSSFFSASTIFGVCAQKIDQTMFAECLINFLCCRTNNWPKTANISGWVLFLPKLFVCARILQVKTYTRHGHRSLFDWIVNYWWTILLKHRIERTK